MPPTGFKSITVRQEAYDMLMKEYKEKSQEWLMRHGITAFSGYVTFRLSELIELRKQTLQSQAQEDQPAP